MFFLIIVLKIATREENLLADYTVFDPKLIGKHQKLNIIINSVTFLLVEKIIQSEYIG
jgi:hypothetical protein